MTSVNTAVYGEPLPPYRALQMCPTFTDASRPSPYPVGQALGEPSGDTYHPSTSISTLAGSQAQATYTSSGQLNFPVQDGAAAAATAPLGGEAVTRTVSTLGAESAEDRSGSDGGYSSDSSFGSSDAQNGTDNKSSAPRFAL